jgi:hypothetical protein
VLLPRKRVVGCAAVVPAAAGSRQVGRAWQAGSGVALLAALCALQSVSQQHSGDWLAAACMLAAVSVEAEQQRCGADAAAGAAASAVGRRAVGKGAVPTRGLAMCGRKRESCGRRQLGPAFVVVNACGALRARGGRVCVGSWPTEPPHAWAMQNTCVGHTHREAHRKHPDVLPSGPGSRTARDHQAKRQTS